MICSPASEQEGLYERPGFRAGETGTFALIIGISTYQSVSPLSTSAYTAARFFHWLIHEERYSPAPIKRARLLLSPTDAERAAIASEFGLVKFSEATFANIEIALNAWLADINAIATTGETRSIFFFTGHGIDYPASGQMLLPKDYLTTGSAERCVSTLNLQRGLSNTAAATQLYFLDACRNSGQLRDQVPPTGYPIFATPAKYRSPEIITLRAAVGGTLSMQTKNIEDGGSIFGVALHEALTLKHANPPRMKADETVSPAVVRLADIHDYMNSRARGMLSLSKNIITLGGDFTDLKTALAEVTVDSVEGGITEQLYDPHDVILESMLGFEPTPGIGEAPERFTTIGKLSGDHLRSYLHAIFGHEYMSDFLPICVSSQDRTNWSPSPNRLEFIECLKRDESHVMRFRLEASMEFTSLQFPQGVTFFVPPLGEPTIFELRAYWEDERLDDVSLDLAPQNSRDLIEIANAFRNGLTTSGVLNEWASMQAAGTIARLLWDALRSRQGEPSSDASTDGAAVSDLIVASAYSSLKSGGDESALSKMLVLLEMPPLFNTSYDLLLRMRLLRPTAQILDRLAARYSALIVPSTGLFARFET